VGGSILVIEAAAAFDDLTRSGRDALMEPEPERSTWPAAFRGARFVPAVEYINANRARTLLMERMHEAMRDVDVVIMPNTGLNLTNLTGHPQVSLPAGFRVNDRQRAVPVSIQFIGQLFGEAKLLRVAQAWQDATGHHRRHPAAFVP
jgi:Asp-tRNA(Asn)/Glu-tRNA(Gln) amidotransferase A subunit family amidase